MWSNGVPDYDSGILPFKPEIRQNTHPMINKYNFGLIIYVLLRTLAPKF